MSLRVGRRVDLCSANGVMVVNAIAGINALKLELEWSCISAEPEMSLFSGLERAIVFHPVSAS